MWYSHVCFKTCINKFIIGVSYRKQHHAVKVFVVNIVLVARARFMRWSYGSQAVKKLPFLLKILCNAKPILFRRGELGRINLHHESNVIINYYNRQFRSHYYNQPCYFSIFLDCSATTRSNRFPWKCRGSRTQPAPPLQQVKQSSRRGPVWCLWEIDGPQNEESAMGAEDPP